MEINAYDCWKPPKDKQIWDKGVQPFFKILTALTYTNINCWCKAEKYGCTKRLSHLQSKKLAKPCIYIKGGKRPKE